MIAKRLILLGLAFGLIASVAVAQNRRAARGNLDSETVLRDVPYCTNSGVVLALDLYRPKMNTNSPAPVAIYVHGGGWRSGSKRTGGWLEPIATALTARGYLVAAVDYRLAPKHTWPAYIQDVKTAVRFLRANASKYNLDPHRIGAWGTSAGGHLVAMLGTADSSAGLEGEHYLDQSSRVQAVVDFFGPSDIVRMAQKPEHLERARTVFGLNAAAIKQASPVTFVSRDDPPFLIIQGEKDPLVLPEQAQVLFDKLTLTGVPAKLLMVKNGVHGLNGNNLVPSREEILKTVVEFFDKHLKGVTSQVDQKTRPSASSSKHELDCNYPGGNILVEKTEGDLYIVKPDLRDIQPGKWWFYWNFRAKNAEGRKLTFRFTEQNPIGVHGPAISRDGGLSWSWMGSEVVRAVKGTKAWEFSYQFGENERETRFSYCIPYLQSDWERFTAKHKTSIRSETLCKSQKGRPVECVRIGNLTNAANRVLLTARHHACESVADYVLEGLLEFALTDPKDGARLLQKTEIMAIPFVDKDGVEDGDQGKNRAPHDHNRDYAGHSIYPSVAAIRARVPQWSEGKLRVAIDLHCPGIRGKYAEAIHFAGSDNPSIWAKTVEFASLLERTQCGPIKYATSDNVPFGVAWNTTNNYADGVSCARWAREIPGITFATTIEIPYATARGTEVTAETARAFGRDLARALSLYLNIR